jgi:hypothetical protein
MSEPSSSGVYDGLGQGAAEAPVVFEEPRRGPYLATLELAIPTLLAVTHAVEANDDPRARPRSRLREGRPTAATLVRG